MASVSNEVSRMIGVINKNSATQGKIVRMITLPKRSNGLGWGIIELETGVERVYITQISKSWSHSSHVSLLLSYCLWALF